MDKKNKITIPAILIIAICVISFILEVVPFSAFGLSVVSVFLPIVLEIAFWILIVFAIIRFSKNANKKVAETENKDIFEQNINENIFNTSDNIQKQTHQAEHVINNEKCEVIIEKPNKACSFCGAKNPTSAKFCDCCGKKLK